MKQADPTYHIIGGGLAGLSCAYFLKQKREKCKVIVYEAEAYLGGRFLGEIDKKTNMNYMLHIVSEQDKFMASYARPEEWKKNLCFFDYKTEKLSSSGRDCVSALFKIFSGVAKENIVPSVRRKLKNLVHAHWPQKRKFWFVGKDFNERIINVLAMYADEILLNRKLKKIMADSSQQAVKLKFDEETVELGSCDKVIIALDNQNCQKIINVPLLKTVPLINIVYQTSQTIFLPNGVSFLGIKNGIADWLYSVDNTVTAVIADYMPRSEKLIEIAQKIWIDLDKIRKVNSAFVPTYKILYYKNALVAPDEQNEKNKPKTAATEYKNVFLAGDWTLKNEPCRLETAVKSAQRAVNTALKFRWRD